MQTHKQTQTRKHVKTDGYQHNTHRNLYIAPDLLRHGNLKLARESWDRQTYMEEADRTKIDQTNKQIRDEQD